LLVSHDREFLNNVVTSTLVFEGQGNVKEYAGGYDDWLRQRKVEERPPARSAESSRPARPPVAPAARPARLKFAEQRELDALPDRIERLERQVADIHEEMAAQGFYQQQRDAIVATSDRLRRLEEELAAAYARWEELEGRAG
ncbi:MAG: ABC transporter ATP-binding protein, partial [Thermoguttaceae bacterium]|nr:ABC transporter ATP-binding protein [Thermoguttaceae bacterium]